MSEVEGRVSAFCESVRAVRVLAAVTLPVERILSVEGSDGAALRRGFHVKISDLSRESLKGHECVLGGREGLVVV